MEEKKERRTEKLNCVGHPTKHKEQNNQKE